ncbi:MAG: SPFH domain-containing protein [Bacteroidota bacterium]|nr:SPFH domain-containing protein [Bacteroidota bacterium]
MEAVTIILIIIIVFAFIVAVSSIKMVSQATVKIIERLGKYHKTATSGLNIIVPFIDSVRATLDLREQLTDIEPQPVITRDNVTMEVDCVVYWQIIDPIKAVYEISQLKYGIQQLTLSALRAVIGEMDLDHTLAGRDQINTKLRASLDSATDKWGVKVMRIELRNILPPEDIRLTMEKQMTAERNRRAVILEAEGEKQAAILRAEGQKQSAIVAAEGKKQSAILEAEGQAEARLRVANAEAQAITVVSQALKTQAGDPASYLVAMKYLESLKDISFNAQKIVFLPFEAAGVMGSLGGMKEMLGHIGVK